MRIVWTSQFKKDYKRAGKQGRPLEKLKDLAKKLAQSKKLDAKYRDHVLKGKTAKKGDRECHIQGDWLLVYRKAKDALIFVRLGSHSELFD